MTSENSPIKQYYPEEFSKDLNGKKQDWEAVVLIPFIDQVNITIHMCHDCDCCFFFLEIAA